jgi:hypothetical protein
VIRPAITAQISSTAGRRDQGAVLGLTQSITSICQVMAPVMVGALIDRGFLAAWALAGAGIAFCGMFAALRFKRAEG